MKILYVEDNPMNLRLVRKFLQNNQVQVLWAADGLSGLELALQEIPDLILMDINLPIMDGLEVMKLLRQKPETAELPMIALSANTRQSDKEQYLAAGFDDYIAKPYSHQELLNTIARYLPNLVDT
jgi:CheY-like chemotaxis protein